MLPVSARGRPGARNSGDRREEGGGHARQVPSPTPPPRPCCPRRRRQRSRLASFTDRRHPPIRPAPTQDSSQVRRRPGPGKRGSLRVRVPRPLWGPLPHALGSALLGSMLAPPTPASLLPGFPPRPPQSNTCLCGGHTSRGGAPPRGGTQAPGCAWGLGPVQEPAAEGAQWWGRLISPECSPPPLGSHPIRPPHPAARSQAWAGGTEAVGGLTCFIHLTNQPEPRRAGPGKP